jgi:hypothetical protein
MNQKAAHADKDGSRLGGTKVERRIMGAEGEASSVSARQSKKLRKAERSAVKTEMGPAAKKDTSKDVCKFGDSCRDFMKGIKCGYLHRS